MRFIAGAGVCWVAYLTIKAALTFPFPDAIVISICGFAACVLGIMYIYIWSEDA